MNAPRWVQDACTEFTEAHPHPTDLPRPGSILRACAEWEAQRDEFVQMAWEVEVRRMCATDILNGASVQVGDWRVRSFQVGWPISVPSF